MDVEAWSSNWSLIYIIPDSTSDYLSTLQSTLHEIFAVHDQKEDSMVIEWLMFVNPQYRSIGIKFGMYGWDWIFILEISTTYRNTNNGMIKIFCWNNEVWSIIEDEGIYEMVCRRKIISIILHTCLSCLMKYSSSHDRWSIRLWRVCLRKSRYDGVGIAIKF